MMKLFRRPVEPHYVVEVVEPEAQFENPSKGPLNRLRAEFPHGHPDFIPRLLEIIKLHSDKNHDYAFGGPPLGNFERTAKIMALYPKFPWATDYGCATVQMLKQLDAFLWQAQNPAFTPKVEGGDSRLRDIAVFSQLIAIMLKSEKA